MASIRASLSCHPQTWVFWLKTQRMPVSRLDGTDSDAEHPSARLDDGIRRATDIMVDCVISLPKTSASGIALNFRINNLGEGVSAIWRRVFQHPARGPSAPADRSRVNCRPNHILITATPARSMWQQSDNVAFEQSRNVVLTAPSFGDAGRTTTDDASRS